MVARDEMAAGRGVVSGCSMRQKRLELALYHASQGCETERTRDEAEKMEESGWGYMGKKRRGDWEA